MASLRRRWNAGILIGASYDFVGACVPLAITVGTAEFESRLMVCAEFLPATTSNPPSRPAPWRIQEGQPA